MDDILLINVEKTDPGKLLRETDRMHNIKIIGFLESVSPSYQPFFSPTKYDLYKGEKHTGLLSDPLEKIEKDRSLKKVLWECLQDLYPLK
jgi:hypothetical protein